MTELDKARQWSIDTMLIINKLTPGIKGKAFDPDWFLLRERLEEYEDFARTRELAAYLDACKAMCGKCAVSTVVVQKGQIFLHCDQVAATGMCQAEAIRSLPRFVELMQERK